MVWSTYSSFHNLSVVDLISKSFWECRESNPGLLGEKHEHYLCAMQPPPMLSLFRVMQLTHSPYGETTISMVSPRWWCFFSIPLFSNWAKFFSSFSCHQSNDESYTFFAFHGIRHLLLFSYLNGSLMNDRMIQREKENNPIFGISTVCNGREFLLFFSINIFQEENKWKKPPYWISGYQGRVEFSCWKDINSCICPLGKLDHFREQKYLRPVPIQVIQIG